MKKAIIIIVIICAFISTRGLLKKEEVNIEKHNTISNVTIKSEVGTSRIESNSLEERKEINDWRLILVNSENSLPENYELKLSYIDSSRQFDSRAIGELDQMLLEMRKCGISDIWVQSSYRSVEYQNNLFYNKINTFMKQGKTEEEAELLTLQTINRPGTSEHNLGLAVDFNYVDYNFENTKAFEWLNKNAENYGFVLRYQKEKENITKVDYEPWHWRYVGLENARKMNELGMCLEEYVEYLLTMKS